MAYTKLALRGGGVRGMIYIGLVDILTRLDILKGIDAVSGSSVGGIGALLVATGWPLDKIKAKMLSLDFDKILNSDSRLSSVPIIGKVAEPMAEASNLEKLFGLHTAQGFEDFFKSVIEEVTRVDGKPGNPETTFLEWHELRKKRPELKDIFVEACNMNVGPLNEVFSYNTVHKNVPIWKALRGSMAFPFYFTPQEIKGCLYNDGGMQKNCPTDPFEVVPGEPNPEVLSVWLDTEANINFFVNNVRPAWTAIPNLISFLATVIDAATSAETYNNLKSLYREQMIYCGTAGISTLDFAALKDPKAIASMIFSGVIGTLSYFLRKHPELVAEKMKQTTVDDILQQRFKQLDESFATDAPKEAAPDIFATFSKEILTLLKSKPAAKPEAVSTAAATPDAHEKKKSSASHKTPIV